MIAERRRTLPEPIVDAVAVQIAEQIVGIVGAVDVGTARPRRRPTGHGRRTARMAAGGGRGRVRNGADPGSCTAPSRAAPRPTCWPSSSVGPPVDLQAFLARGRRLGVELTGGGIAISARRLPGDGAGAELTVADRALAFELRHRGSALADATGT